MARYDVDEQLQFVQGQLDTARERREKTAKEQEKFSKKLLLADTVVKGATSFLNNRADQLDAANAPAKAKYQSYIKDANDTLTYWDTVTKNGGKSYLQQQIFNTYLEAAKNERPFDEVKNIQSWLNEQAEAKANDLYGSLEKKALEARDVPTLDEFIEGYEQFSKQAAPRSLFGAAVKGFKNIIGVETPDTLEYKKKVAKDKVFDAPMFKEIREFKEVAETFDKLGYDTPGLIAKMKEQYKDGKKIGKKIKSQTTKNVSYNSSPGILTNDILSEIIYEDGSTKVDVIHSSKNYNDSLMLDSSSELSFLSKIKPEFQDQVVDILKDGGNGVGLKTNISKAYSFALEKNALKIDLEDTQKAIKIIDSLYQDILQGKFTKDGIPMAMYDQESKMFKVSSDYSPIAKKEGWDAETFRQTQLNQLGINYTVNQVKQSGDTETTKLNTIESQITDPTKLKQYNDLIENPNTLLAKYTLNQTRNKTGIVDITNGTPVELSKFFPNIVEGTGIIKYDTDTSKYFIEASEGDLGRKFNVINITGGDTTGESETGEPINISEKYKIDEDTITKFKNVKPKIGGVTQQAPGREDPIDLVTDEMLYNAGYLERGYGIDKDTAFNKFMARRRFLNDLYKDLNI